MKTIYKIRVKDTYERIYPIEAEDMDEATDILLQMIEDKRRVVPDKLTHRDITIMM